MKPEVSVGAKLERHIVAGNCCKVVVPQPPLDLFGSFDPRKVVVFYHPLDLFRIRGVFEPPHYAGSQEQNVCSPQFRLLPLEHLLDLRKRNGV